MEIITDTTTLFPHFVCVIQYCLTLATVRMFISGNMLHIKILFYSRKCASSRLSVNRGGGVAVYSPLGSMPPPPAIMITTCEKITQSRDQQRPKVSRRRDLQCSEIAFPNRSVIYKPSITTTDHFQDFQRWRRCSAVCGNPIYFYHLCLVGLNVNGHNA